MIALFHVLVCLFLVVVQTTWLPLFTRVSSCYDLMIPFVVYLGLCSSLRKGLPLVLVAGAIIDQLSGAPAGLYFSAYGWLFMGIRWITGYFRMENILFLPCAMAAGVLVEVLLYCGAVMLHPEFKRESLFALGSLPWHLAAAICTGPIIFLALRTLQRQVARWSRYRPAHSR